MNQSKAEAMVARLLANAAGVRYGSVSVSAKMHEGRVVELAFSTTENTREPENCKKSAEKGEIFGKLTFTSAS
jgi:hypothetical protein